MIFKELHKLFQTNKTKFNNSRINVLVVSMTKIKQARNFCISIKLVKKRILNGHHNRNFSLWCFHYRHPVFLTTTLYQKALFLFCHSSLVMCRAALRRCPCCYNHNHHPCPPAPPHPNSLPFFIPILLDPGGVQPPNSSVHKSSSFVVKFAQ